MKKVRSSGSHLLTRAEVAEVFQVSPSTVTRWAETGKLPVVKTLGGHRRYEAGVVLELARRFGVALSDETVLKVEEETRMAKTEINVPAMYGDHHVLEVRRILLALPGVEAINASSCFQTVEVDYDPTTTSVEEITARLEEAGYLDPLSIPVEAGVAVAQDIELDREIFFRHTNAYEQLKQVISFGQTVPSPEPALWPCPGIGAIKRASPEIGELKEISHG